MGQVKNRKPDTININAGHSLILGNMPSIIPPKDYGNLKFGGFDVLQLGLFSSPDYNTFYPGVTQEDFTPKEEDYIEPVFRLLSEVIVNKEWNPVDFSMGGVLKASAPMLVGQTVNCDHSTDIANAIGSVKETFWQEQQKTEGILVPAGIGGVLKIDARANPRIARGILMTPPSVHSNSVSVNFTWDKSHPKMDDRDFWSKLGTYDEKGQLIRRVVTEVNAYFETSLVSHGADPFAQKVNENGDINNPKWASRQSYSANKGNEVEYYFFDFKAINKAAVINNTTAFNITSENQKHSKNSSKMNEDEIKLLSTLVGAGLITLKEGKEVTLDNVKAAISELVSNHATLSTQVETLTNENTTLKTEVGNLKAEVAKNAEMATLGTSYISGLRTEVEELYKKTKETPDENIIQLIASASEKQLLSLKTNYTEELEKKFPMSCKDCGSHNVDRGSAQASANNDTEGTPKSFGELAKNMAAKLNKGSMFNNNK